MDCVVFQVISQRESLSCLSEGKRFANAEWIPDRVRDDRLKAASAWFCVGAWGCPVATQGFD